MTPAPRPTPPPDAPTGSGGADAPHSGAGPGGTATPARPRRWRRRVAALALAAVGVLVLAALALWVWAGSEGSLATALRWAGASTALVSDEPTGTVRKGGRVRRILWEKDGLRVEVRDAELSWQPLALLGGTLRIDRLAAARIEIDDRRPPSGQPSRPPQSLRLPLGVDVAELSAGALVWVGPPRVEAGDIAGSYRYTGGEHRLRLEHARIQDGQYRVAATVSALGAPALDLTLDGQLAVPVPGASAPLPVTARAHAKGALTDLRIEADVNATPAAAAVASAASAAAVPDHPVAAASAASAADGLPRAHLKARVTPWAAQPLPQADADFSALDLGALWAQAPRTRLTGTLRVTPLDSAGAPLPADAPLADSAAAAPAQTASAGAPGQPSGWALQAHIDNALPGPWDEQRLPLERLVADASWAGGVARVRDLRAQLAGGTLHTQGQWKPSATPVAINSEAPGSAPTRARGQNDPQNTPTTASGSTTAAGGDWRLDTRIDGINPAGLHSQLAAFALDGTARVWGAGSAIDFDLALQAREQRASAPRRQGESAAQARARELQALRLRDAAAQGRWALGLLTLDSLRVRTDDAQLAGRAQWRPGASGRSDTPDGPGGQALLQLSAPGLRATLGGDVWPTRGGGRLQARIDQAGALLGWLKKWPGLSTPLAGASASGQGELRLDWRGGWQDPSVQAQLSVPTLQAQAHAASAPLRARGLQARLDGRLASARLALDGQVQQGARQLELHLAAQAGRGQVAPGTALAASPWRGQIEALRARLADPALGDGPWLAELRAPLSLSWQPAGGGRFEAGAGTLALSSPAPASTASVAWQPLTWQAGTLRTQGRVQNLPLAWADRLSGAPLTAAGLSGEVFFDGDWDLSLAERLRGHATLQRTRGDLTLQTTDPATGIVSRVAAGLARAALRVEAEGDALRARLDWDSAQAGQVQAELRTRLSRQEGAWAWPASAPLDGSVHARLPRVAAWSVLAPPGWRLRGSLAADARIGGTRGAPQWTGTLNGDDLALRSVVDGIEFSGGHLRARLAGTRLLVDEVLLQGAGAAGEGGRIRASGEAGWIDGRAQARLSATLERLRASIRADRQLTVSGQVQAALDGRQVQVDGRLRADRALIVLPEDSAPSLGDDVIVRGAGGRVMYGKQAPATVSAPTSGPARDGGAPARAQAAARRQQAAAQAERASAEAASVRVNVQLDLGPDFRVRGMGVDTRLDGVLTLAAAGAPSTAPRLTGTVSTVGGTFRAYSQNLRIERGRITFSGAIDNPTLDILALRPNYASEQQVGVQVLGTALLPRVSLYSRPALPDNQTLAWLLLGRAAPATGAESAMLQSAALALLGGREGVSLASRFGLDELSLGDAGGGAGLANASLTLGKRLSERFYASYEQSLSGATGTLFVFYELSRRWTLRGQAGVASALDLIFTLSFE